MPTISTGQSATVSVAAGGSIYITAGGFGRIRQGGQDQHFGPSQSTFGPYGAAQDVQITADTFVTYSTADPSSVSGAGISVATSRTALASDNGSTLELASGVTYTLSDAVALPAGAAFQGPVTGSATIAVTGAATINGGTSSVTLAAGKLATALPRASSAAAFLVAVQA